MKIALKLVRTTALIYVGWVLGSGEVAIWSWRTQVGLVAVAVALMINIELERKYDGHAT